MVQVLWEGYAAAMQEAGFDDQTPLYAASGLLTYGATQGMLPHARGQGPITCKWAAYMSGKMLPR